MSEQGTPAGPPTPTARTNRRFPSRMIPPALLAQLGSLELVARSVVDGVSHGAHYTDRPGFSQEFAEYRDYVPGDDPRFVDWNAYARTDRPLLKLFEGETNTRLLVLLDGSASMDAFDAADAPTKLRYAAYLAAALALIAARQHDAVGLLVFDAEPRAYVPPRAGTASLQAIYHRLDDLKPEGGSDWLEAFTQAASRLPKRGIIAAISDFYCDPADFGRSLRILGSRGHDLILFHLLDEAERAPRVRGVPRSRRAFAGGHATLRDVETGDFIEVDANDLLSRYPRRLAAHELALRREAGAVGADYVRLNADEPLDRALAQYLRFRVRRP
ncbi:MAG: DUF58 domain-containing protein [Gammaproteobacteria bacterium]|nr:DUF58 domain-containing protein [Gammaproteobacteria bacterium]MXY57599.1 DUF58 domain-containing protein [Gammaproteobacteria bacterium]MYF28991.1 DUF58 domain-containing protein [Gammaproteobacteria bacterium]MYK47136.1 DUF58 domain-containing protein [Gammaproteobacteria bacterium]